MKRNRGLQSREAAMKTGCIKIGAPLSLLFSSSLLLDLPLLPRRRQPQKSAPLTLVHVLEEHCYLKAFSAAFLRVVVNWKGSETEKRRGEKTRRREQERGRGRRRFFPTRREGRKSLLPLSSSSLSHSLYLYLSHLQIPRRGKQDLVRAGRLAGAVWQRQVHLDRRVDDALDVFDNPEFSYGDALGSHEAAHGRRREPRGRDGDPHGLDVRSLG